MYVRPADSYNHAGRLSQHAGTGSHERAKKKRLARGLGERPLAQEYIDSFPRGNDQLAKQERWGVSGPLYPGIGATPAPEPWPNPRGWGPAPSPGFGARGPGLGAGARGPGPSGAQGRGWGPGLGPF